MEFNSLHSILFFLQSIYILLTENNMQSNDIYKTKKQSWKQVISYFLSPKVKTQMWIQNCLTKMGTVVVCACHTAPSFIPSNPLHHYLHGISPHCRQALTKHTLCAQQPVLCIEWVSLLPLYTKEAGAQTPGSTPRERG